MTEVQATLDSDITKEYVVNGMLEKKALDIVVLDLKKVTNAVADYFVICTGNSDSQIDAITDSVEEEVFKASGLHPWRKEGKEGREWMLIDFVDVVVHIFRKEKREFYALEKLWGDATIITIDS